ncbi:hypothetical protein, partial [Mycobacterium intracellulare]|uniref:hypothetical protein n=1 Tax=Mycobacterium intracellulare TaxID=1767 RepID=UPI001F33ADE2
MPSGTYAPTPVDIRAVPAQITQELMRTRETWHWTDGPPPSPAIFKGHARDRISRVAVEISRNRSTHATRAPFRCRERQGDHY